MLPNEKILWQVMPEDSYEKGFNLRRRREFHEDLSEFFN
jgi:hypothetical protein